MKRILMLLAEKNFRDIEYIVPRAFFEQNGAEVKTASTSDSSIGKYGYEVKNDFRLDMIKPSDFDAIFIVGGGGSLQYKDDDLAKTLVTSFLDLQKPTAAICAAPQNLLHWGLGRNREVTGWNEDGVFYDLAVKVGAIPKVSESVVKDGLMITGNGPSASELTAKVLLGALGI